MQEKRRDKRLPVCSMKLEISSLFKQDNQIIKNIDAPISVHDISKGGIGFITKSDLPLNFYFNACIQLGDADAKLYCVVKIGNVVLDGVYSWSELTVLKDHFEDLKVICGDDIEKALDEADREAEDPNTKYYTHEEMKQMARRIIVGQ